MTRPNKRQRVDSDSSVSSTSSSTMVDDRAQAEKFALQRLPDPLLLLSLPKLLIHPPNHPYYSHGLCLSLLALRKCLQLKSASGFTPEIECRAWTSLAEVGMAVIESGFAQDSVQHKWAEDVQLEVEKATSQGLLIAQKHPSLFLYRPHLTLLNGRLAALQNNTKFARNLLKRFMSTMNKENYPPRIVYQVHLAYIDLFITPSPTPPSINDDQSPPLSPHPSNDTAKDTLAALRAIQMLSSAASNNSHDSFVLLASVIKLRLLVCRGMWSEVEQALTDSEALLGITIAPVTAKEPSSPNKALQSVNTNIPSPSVHSPKPTVAQSQPDLKKFQPGFESSMAIHILLIGVVFHTFIGSEKDATPRLSYLHSLLDSGALSSPSLESGIVEVPLGPTDTLRLRTTHPNVLLPLAFLTSAVAKRDPVGRKPKRKLFATEGVHALDKIGKKDPHVPLWSTTADIQDIDIQLAKLKADLWCEVVGVAIQRCEFTEAEQALDSLIAHTRTHNIFPSFAARITLHHAHLAHAKGDTHRALECYRAAQLVSDAASLVVLNTVKSKARRNKAPMHLPNRGSSPSTDAYVALSSMAGEVALRLGILKEREAEKTQSRAAAIMRRRTISMSQIRNNMDIDEDDDDPLSLLGSPLTASSASQSEAESDVDPPNLEESPEMLEIRTLAGHVISLSKTLGLGGTMSSISKVLEACMYSDEEVLSAKTALKQALHISTQAQDNHLRALILSFLASHFVHTAPDHAVQVLKTVEFLGSGMGAKPKLDKKSSPNVQANEGDAIGNGALRIWVAERFLEIYKRAASTSDETTRTGAKRKVEQQQTAIRSLKISWDRLLSQEI